VLQYIGHHKPNISLQSLSLQVNCKQNGIHQVVQCLFCPSLHCLLDDWCSSINLYSFLQETLRNNWLHQYEQNMFINPTKDDQRSTWNQSYVETTMKHWGKDILCNFNVFIIKYMWFLTSFLWFATSQQQVSVPMKADQYYTVSAPALPIPATATAAATTTRYHGPCAFDCCHFDRNLAAARGLMTPTGNSCLVVLDPRSNTQSSHFQFCSMMLQKAWLPSSKQQHEMMPAAWMPVVGTMTATATNNITSFNNQP